MIDCGFPVNFSHWHTEPALIGGLLFVSWCYTIMIGPYRTNICPIYPSRENMLIGFSYQ